MSFSSKINNGIYTLPYQPRHDRSVTNVAPNKAMTWIPLQVFKILEVSSIGELVKVNDFIIGIFPKYVPNKVGSYESRSSRDQKPHAYATPVKIPSREGKEDFQPSGVGPTRLEQPTPTPLQRRGIIFILAWCHLGSMQGASEESLC